MGELTVIPGNFGKSAPTVDNSLIEALEYLISKAKAGTISQLVCITDESGMLHTVWHTPSRKDEIFLVAMLQRTAIDRTRA